MHPSPYVGERCWRILTSPISNSFASRSIRPKAASAPCVSPAPGQKPCRPAGRFAPRLGQHTREILAEVGYTPKEIDALIAQHAVMLEGTRS